MKNVRNKNTRCRGGCLVLAGLIVVAGGCASTQTAVKTGQPKPGEKSDRLTPPPRDVSKAAKAAFAEVVVSYSAAKKNGINKESCASFAEKFADVYDDFPKLVEAKFNQGAVLHECGELDQAERVYRQLLQKHPKYGRAINNIGQIAMARGNRSVAEEYFKKAIEAHDSAGYANLALLRRDAALAGNKKMLQEAVKDVYRALALDSFNYGAYGILATLVYDNAKRKSGLEIARLICVQAMKRFPDYAAIYNVLGLVLLRMDEVTRALAQFRKAVSLKPDFIEAHMNVGAITLSFRDYKTAGWSFKQVLAQSPDKKTRFDATVGLGVAYRGARRYDEALKQYEAAQKLDPTARSVDYNIGILLQDYLFDAENPARGLDQLKQARQRLQRFAESVSRRNAKGKDARRRIRNINEMIPILQEQVSAGNQAG